MIEARSVGIVGVGSVGTAAAYATFLRRAASEILLVDLEHARAEGVAMDVMHGQALVGRTDVRAATFAELAASQIIVITAGRNQRPGETRLQLLRDNANVVRTIIGELDRHAPEAILLVATNPVDILTDIAIAESSRPASRILGTGTTLDSARFRALLGLAYGVSPRAVHAMVIGEHGESQVPLWSLATVGGSRIVDGPIAGVSLDGAARDRIARETRCAASEIISRKGHTDLGIGVVVARLVEDLLDDARVVHPVSVKAHGELGVDGVCLGIPCILGRAGVIERTTPKLDETERRALHASAEALRTARATL